nr:hypothetical protein CFP56_50026 [Quercus suber]
MAKPIPHPSPSCAFVNPSREERWLLAFKVAAAVLVLLILFVTLVAKLRQCNSSSGGGHVDVVNCRTSFETSIQLPDMNTDDGSVSVSV